MNLRSHHLVLSLLPIVACTEGKEGDLIGKDDTDVADVDGKDTDRLDPGGEVVYVVQGVDAGPSQVAAGGQLVTLTGLLEDGDEGWEPQWVQTAGPPVALDAATSLTPSFTAPRVEADTLLLFTLQGLRGLRPVATDDTTVLVRANLAPTVDAGLDQAVDEEVQVVLAGTAEDADGSIADVIWTQLSGPEVVLGGTDPLQPSFQAPKVPGVVTLLFRLDVTDDEGGVGTDYTTVQVTPVNLPPRVGAGVDQVVEEGASVGLFGTATDDDGEVRGTLWVQTQGLPVTLTGATTLTPTFQAPPTGVGTTLVFRLEAVDDDGLLGTDTVQVVVTTTNPPPTVDAGGDQEVFERQVVTLTGSASDDSDVASTRWVQVAGPPAFLADPASLVTTFTAPSWPERITVAFRLEATDDEGATATDTVAIVVVPSNLRPVVDAGDDQDVLEGDAVSLSGTASDPDGTVATTVWTQLAGPQVTLDDPASLTPAFSAPLVAKPEAVVFSLTATDDLGRASTDVVVVRITPLNARPVAEAGADRRVTAGAVVTLVGSATDADGTIVRVAWRELGTDLVTLSDTDVLSPSFTAPDLDFPVGLTFELEVEDDEGAVSTDRVRITVDPDETVNLRPSAYAGPDRTVTPGVVVQLQGTASDPDGSIVATRWTQVAGPTVSLADPDTLTPRWTAPDVVCADVVVMELEVEDDAGAVRTDRVSVIVQGLESAAPLPLPAVFDLEQDDGGIRQDGDVWAWGVPTTGPGAAYTGTRVWATNLDGGYPPNAVARACLPPLDLTGQLSPTLSFRLFLALVNDAFLVEGLDPRAGWVPLVDAVPPPSLVAVGQPSWPSTPVSETWVFTAVRLPLWLGDTARVRLVLASSPSAEAAGAYVDDLRVDDESSDPDADGLDGVLDEWLLHGTDPFVADADGDGALDGLEVASGTDPRNPADVPGLTPRLPGFRLDFEADAGGLVSTGSTWEIGAPAMGPGRAASGSTVWATGLASGYRGHTRAYLYLPPVDLRAALDPTLSFRGWFRILAQDGVLLEAWHGPSATWRPVVGVQPPYDGTDAIGLAAWRRLGGSTGTYDPVAVSLAPWVGEVVRLRFAFRSDYNGESWGAYLDDVGVHEEGADPDADGVPGILAELARGLDPFAWDSDGDGFSDGAERDAGTDGRDPAWSPGVTTFLSPGTLLDFEDGPGGLVATSAPWEHGVFASGPPLGAPSGTRGWATVLGGDYRIDAEGYLHLPPLDLAEVAPTTLSFRLWSRSVSLDGVSVEVARPDGTWATLAPAQPAYDGKDALLRPAWVNQRDVKEPVFAAFSLGDLTGGMARLRFAFRSNTDGSVGPGAYLDDLALDLESADPDGDGLVGVLDELRTWGTDPYLADTDGDGFLDGEEVAAGTDPLLPSDHPGVVHLGPGTYLDFEADDGGLAASGAPWEVGVLASTATKAFSGSRVWATDLDDYYGPSEHGWVGLPPIDVPAAGSTTLSFRMWVEGRPLDGLSVEAWRPATGWTTLQPALPAYDGQDALGRPAWVTQSFLKAPVWAALPLDAFAGTTARLRLAFRSNEDGAYAFGAVIDDLAIDVESDDPDGDGLVGVVDEFLAYGTDPYLPDTDGDGVDDGDEVAAGTDPLNPADHATELYLAPGSYLDFERGPSGLVASSVDWAFGTPTRGPAGAWSGSQVWAVGLTTAYRTPAASSLWLPPVDVPASGEAVLSFRVYMHSSNDGLSLEAWTEDGTWVTVLPDVLPYNGTDGVGRPAWNYRYGPNDSYVWAAFSLAPWAGGLARLRLAFRANADAFVGWGAFVDDIAVDLESSDPDGDGLDGVIDEWMLHGTDPYRWDSDGDGFGDGAEVAAGSDPLDAQDVP
ncbi:MAG: hypothetical protein H6732_07875 [Alphaproteobacteria bacterium]|nr:hypothetical protein [Alphaproteobacteria bacterium]